MLFRSGVIPRTRLPEVLNGIKALADEAGMRVANVFHAGDGNLHPLIIFDIMKPGEFEKAEEFGADILRLCVKVGGVLFDYYGAQGQIQTGYMIMFAFCALAYLAFLRAGRYG